MPGRCRFRAAEGGYERFDGTNAPAIAGDQYEGADADGHPVVRSGSGDPYTLRPGWVVSRRDGADVAGVRDPWAWAEDAEEIS
jgi:hypothetical protein